MAKENYQESKNRNVKMVWLAINISVMPTICIWNWQFCLPKVFYILFYFSGMEHPREDKPDLYYWAEIMGQHTQTFNV